MGPHAVRGCVWSVVVYASTSRNREARAGLVLGSRLCEVAAASACGRPCVRVGDLVRVALHRQMFLRSIAYIQYAARRPGGPRANQFS